MIIYLVQAGILTRVLSILKRVDVIWKAGNRRLGLYFGVRCSVFGVRCSGRRDKLAEFLCDRGFLLWYVAELCLDWLCPLRFSYYQQVNMAFSIRCTDCLEHDEECIYSKSTRQKACDACAFSKAKCDLQEKLRRSDKKRKRDEGGEESEVEELPPPRK